MNKEEFIELLQKPEKLDPSTVLELNNLVEEFPYCQSSRVLLTLNLFKVKSIKYDSELKTTAVYVSNRSLLRKQMSRLVDETTKVVLPDEEFPESTKEEVEEKVKEEKPVTEKSVETAEEEAASIAEVKDIIDRHLRELEEENELRKSQEHRTDKKPKAAK